MEVVEIDGSDLYDEGRRVLRSHLAVERNRKLRADAKAYWQVKQNGSVRCRACEFDFRKTYGDHSEGFIEMHHLRPLAEIWSPSKVAVKDLIPLCSNCHRMVHRDPGSMLEFDELKSIVVTARSQRSRSRR